MTSRDPSGRYPRNARRLIGTVAASCLALAGLPARAPGQETSRPVLVNIRVVSEGGSELAGASLRVEDVTTGVDSAGRAIRLVAESETVSLRLMPGHQYRILVEAPGHRGKTANISSSGPTTVRLVLAVDPYELPPIIAAANDGAGLGQTRSIFQARFAEESLTYATVADWLRDVPGVTLRGRGPGGGQALSVRGSRPEDVLVLLDGVPLNDPLTGRADLAMIPTSTLESGTLVHGAASQRYGSGAGAGVLLLTSRMGHGSGLSGGLRMGSFGGLALDMNADAMKGESRLGISLSAARAENDFSFRDALIPGGSTQRRANADAASLHAALHATSGPVFGSLRFDRAERGVPGRAGTSVFEAARAEDRSWIMAAGIDGRVFRGSASYGSHLLGYRASVEDVVSAQQVGELRIAGDWNLPTAPLTLGGRLTREAVKGDAIVGAPARTTVGGRMAAFLISGPFRADPAVSLDIVGDRVVASPDLAVSWVPDSQARVWGRVGQGFRLPTFGDLYFASQYQLRPNPDLEPERITFDTELGIEVREGTGPIVFESSASAWARRTERPIVWLASSVALWSPANLGELWASGIDLQVEVAAPMASVGWRAQFAGTLQSSRVGFGSNRNPLPYEPGATGRLSVEAWRSATGVRLDVRYTGARSTSLAGTRDLDAFTTMDLSARHHFDAGSLRIGLFARVDNILDRRYQLVELFPEPGRHFTFRLEAGRATS